MNISALATNEFMNADSWPLEDLQAFVKTGVAVSQNEMRRQAAMQAAGTPPAETDVRRLGDLMNFLGGANRALALRTIVRDLITFVQDNAPDDAQDDAQDGVPTPAAPANDTIPAPVSPTVN
jgi:hypothetical protein